jgi:hypothetical protein
VRQAEDEPNRSSRARRQRGDISIADIVTAAARLGATDPADLTVIGQVLHLTTPIVPVTPTQRLNPAPSGPSMTLSSTMVSSQVTTMPHRAGVTGAPVAARLRQDDHVEPIPAWLDAVSALSPAGSGSFKVPPEPPLPAVQARSSIAALAAARRPGRRLDMVTLVKRSARLQPPTACFVAELRTASFVQVLVDRGEGMEPYVDDLDFLAAQFVDVAGRDRVEQRTFVGTPRRGLDPDVFTGETAKWKRPAARSLVLVLTDLGVGGPPGSRDRAPAYEWRAVAETVALAQAHLRVLTPFPPGRLPAGLVEIMRLVSWESLAHLVQLRG